LKQIKAAIVGLGRIASLLEDDLLREKPCTHAGAIAANKNCILAAGSDIVPERNKLFATKWKVPVYENVSQMLKTEKPEILCIATHPDSHYHYCRLAAEYAVKVVICEKPLADNLEDATKIAKLGKKLKIITNHERRYSLDYIRAKEILDSEKLGKLLSVKATLYFGNNRRLLNILWHDGTHLVDVIMFLTGSVIKHHNNLGKKLDSKKGTAWLEGSLKKPAIKNSSVPTIIEIGAERNHLVFEIEFSCEKGRLRIGNGIFEVWESIKSPYAENFRSLKKTDAVFTGPTGYFSNMVKDAVLCVQKPDTIPRSGATDGLNVIEYLNSVAKWE